jgi:hypothetical protein
MERPMRALLEDAAAGRLREALDRSGVLLMQQPDCLYLLVWRAILIQAQDSAEGPTLEEAEECLLRAHATDPNYLPALEELAHFDDAIRPADVKAQTFAAAYLEKSTRPLEEMREILNGKSGMAC